MQRLAVCTSVVLYMMSCDHIAMHIDAASLQLMLRLLSLDSAATVGPQHTTCDTNDDDDDLCRTRARLHEIVQQTGQHAAAAITLDNMTVGSTEHVQSRSVLLHVQLFDLFRNLKYMI